MKGGTGSGACPALFMDFASDRYSKMWYRKCGNSGLRLPAISIGFWQTLGEPGHEWLCRDIMVHAFNKGINHFDFANNYGPPPGNAELVAGKILKEFPRDEMIISTKAGFRMWDGPHGDGGSKKYLIASLDQSLKRLGLDYVDIFYHHRHDPDTPIEETMEALDLIVKQGKAIYAGVSNYLGAEFHRAVAVTRDRRLTRLTIHQPRYNMLMRLPETYLLPTINETGVGVIAYCPLAQGILTDRYLNGLPVDSRQGKNNERGAQWFEDRKREGVWGKVAALNDLAAKRGQTLAQMALRWCLRDERLTSVLIGVSRVEQLTENMRAIDGPGFTGEELLLIDKILG